MGRNGRSTPVSKERGNLGSPRSHKKVKIQDKTPKKKLTSSARLMSEEEDDSEDDTGDEGLSSRTVPILVEEIPDYESDTDIKEKASQEPETPKKRGRGRPRKGESPKKPLDLTPRRSGRRQELERKREEEEKLERERELFEQERRRKRREAELEEQRELEREQQLELEAHNAMLIEQGLEPVSPTILTTEPLTSPKKRTSPRKPLTPKKRQRRDLSGSPSPSKGSVERRSRVGRPSKQENVTKQVVSIFQMDDLEIFPDRKGSPNDAKISDSKASDSKAPNTNSSISLNFENKGQSTFLKTPTISGIRRSTPKTSELDVSEAKKFTPFPVPELDEEGNLKDPNFIKTHLSDVAVSFDPNARLTDERAFFLEGSEGYFEQHSLRFRASTNSLAANAPPLDYEEFIPMIALGQLIHKDEKDMLRKYQKELFHQWCFELSQGYNLNFFGVGSKASMIMEFLDEYFLGWYSETVQDDETLPRVMVINGYNPATKLKTVIHDIVSVVVSDEDKTKPNFKMPKHVSEVFPFLMSYLKRNVTQSQKNNIIKPRLVLVVHNIDGEAFRDERSQNLLSQLASLPNVWLLVSTDNINVGLLWDLYRFKNFNFIWHDITTYEAFGVEMSFKDVLSMGKSKKFVGSKGVKFVLASLTTNAKNLYKVVLKMQLDKLEQMTASKSARTGLRANLKLGLELKAVYEKCVQEYIASNEINFKTMLGEFVEHKMCSLAKNSAGTDIVFVPFTYDEMEKLLQDEFGEKRG
ncbi:hypothetical protein JCM33374_g5651 [Metschnikowia sp. JCM 33374]|nr:hypothetical protein JCM33374_g5651 [Metschnikowia sp. JCM 33374]